MLGATILVTLGLRQSAGAQTDWVARACRGEPVSRDVYAIHFDPASQLFARATTDPMEGEEIILCIDGPVDPWMSYSWQVAANEEGAAPDPEELSAASSIERVIDDNRTISVKACQANQSECAQLSAQIQELASAAVEAARTRDDLMRYLVRTGQVHPGTRASGTEAADIDAADTVRARLDAVRSFVCERSDSAARRSGERTSGICDEGTREVEFSAFINDRIPSANFVDGQFRWIRREPPAPRTPDVAADRTTLTVGSPTSATLDPRASNTFTFTPNATGDYEFRASADSPGDDLVLALYENRTGGVRFLDENDDENASTFNPRIERRLEGGVTYVVEVLTYEQRVGLFSGRPARLAYSISVETTAPRPAGPDQEATETAEDHLVRLAEQRTVLENHVRSIVRSYEQLSSLATRILAELQAPRRVFRIGRYDGSRTFRLLLSEHRSRIVYNEERSALRREVDTEVHTLGLTVRDVSWVSFQAGLAISSIDREDFSLGAPIADGGPAIVRDDSRRFTANAVFFATLHWCGQDLSQQIYSRRCAHYAVNDRDNESATGPGAEYVRVHRSEIRRERARRFAPGLALGVPLSRDAFDFNVYAGLSLPYIPYVSVIGGLHLARTPALRSSRIDETGPQITTIESSIDAVTESRLRAGWFIGLVLDDSLFRRLFPSLKLTD